MGLWYEMPITDVTAMLLSDGGLIGKVVLRKATGDPDASRSRVVITRAMRRRKQITCPRTGLGVCLVPEPKPSRAEMWEETASVVNINRTFR